MLAIDGYIGEDSTRYILELLKSEIIYIQNQLIEESDISDLENRLNELRDKVDSLKKNAGVNSYNVNVNINGFDDNNIVAFFTSDDPKNANVNSTPISSALAGSNITLVYKNETSETDCAVSIESDFLKAPINHSLISNKIYTKVINVPNHDVTVNINSIYSPPESDPSSELNDWEFELCIYDKTVTLKKYIGTPTTSMVEVRGSYTWDGKVYRTQFGLDGRSSKLFYNANLNKGIRFNSGILYEKLRDMRYMFYNASASGIYVNGEFDSSHVECMDYTFYGAPGSCTRVMVGTQSGGTGILKAMKDLSSCKSMKYMFAYSGLKAGFSFTWPEGIDTHNVEDMSYMFYANYFDMGVFLQNLDISGVKNLSYLCAGVDPPELMNNFGIPEYDTPNLENASHMLQGCSRVTNNKAWLDFSKWDWRKCKDISYMLSNMGTGLKGIYVNEEKWQYKGSGTRDTTYWSSGSYQGFTIKYK